MRKDDRWLIPAAIWAMTGAATIAGLKDRQPALILIGLIVAWLIYWSKDRHT